MKKRMFLVLVLSIFILGCGNGKDVNLQTESSSYEIDEQIPDTYINGVTECSREGEPELYDAMQKLLDDRAKMQYMLASPDIDLNSEDTIEMADGRIYYPLKDESLSKETLENQLLELYEWSYANKILKYYFDTAKYYMEQDGRLYGQDLGAVITTLKDDWIILQENNCLYYLQGYEDTDVKTMLILTIGRWSDYSGFWIMDELEINLETEGDILDTNQMLWYDIENDKDFFSEGYNQELLEKREIEAVRYYNENNLEVILYTDENDANSYIMINGQELQFSFPGYYSVRDWTCPKICVYDVNNDAIPDIFVSDYYGDMKGMAQDAYLSDENGNYKEIGSVSWNMFHSYEQFPYEITLLDDFEAEIELEEFQISEIIELDEDFAKVAVDLGIYDKWGKVTDYGLEWQSGTEISGYKSPYEKEISYIVNSEGIFVIRVISPIAAGYSSYNLGGGLAFEWMIQDEKYQLLNIGIMYGENISDENGRFAWERVDNRNIIIDSEGTGAEKIWTREGIQQEYKIFELAKKYYMDPEELTDAIWEGIHSDRFDPFANTKTYEKEEWECIMTERYGDAWKTW